MGKAASTSTVADGKPAAGNARKSPKLSTTKGSEVASAGVSKGGAKQASQTRPSKSATTQPRQPKGVTRTVEGAKKQEGGVGKETKGAKKPKSGVKEPKEPKKPKEAKEAKEAKEPKKRETGTKGKDKAATKPGAKSAPLAAAPAEPFAAKKQRPIVKRKHVTVASQQRNMDNRLNTLWSAMPHSKKLAPSKRSRMVVTAKGWKTFLVGAEMQIVCNQSADASSLFGLQERHTISRRGRAGLSMRDGSQAMLEWFVASVLQTVHRKAMLYTESRRKATVSSEDVEQAIAHTNATVFSATMANDVAAVNILRRPAKKQKTCQTSERTREASAEASASSE